MSGDDRHGPDHPKPLKIEGYTLPDVARALGVCARTMRRAIGDGKVATIAVPPHYKLIPAEEFERLRVEGLLPRGNRRGCTPRRRAPAPGQFADAPP